MTLHTYTQGKREEKRELTLEYFNLQLWNFKPRRVNARKHKEKKVAGKNHSRISFLPQKPRLGTGQVAKIIQDSII